LYCLRRRHHCPVLLNLQRYSAAELTKDELDCRKMNQHHHHHHQLLLLLMGKGCQCSKQHNPQGLPQQLLNH